MTDHPVRRWPVLLALLASIALIPGVTGRAAAAEAPRVEAAEVKRLLEKSEAIVIDVRNKDAYDFEHAAGALSIPLAEIEGRLKELPKDKLIAAYCT